MAHSFFGGVHPRGFKELTCESPVRPLHPDVVIISMSQHIGAPCTPLVQIGDRVTVGQKIGDHDGLCVPVHASVSGTVIAVEARPHPSGNRLPAVVIRSDGRNTRCPALPACTDPDSLSPEELIARIREAGITGMGGAGFPTGVKLSSGLGKVDTVLVNGAECEPYITADDRLMREHPERVLGGLRIICRILQPTRTVIGVEANKQQALRALAAQLPQDVQLLPLRVRYPQGAEKQLIQSVTGRFVPPGGLPASVGCAVFNVATCAAIYDAIHTGMPLVQRIVTVTGRAVHAPCNLLVPIGTPLRDLVEAAGGFSRPPYKVIVGGPMMGLTQHTLEAATIKGSNALTCYCEADRREVATPHCIRCGKCVDACPMHLMPVFLHRAVLKQELEQLRQHHLSDCIECGSCAYGCPAGIPLVQSFRTGKRLLREQSAKEAKA